MAAPPNPIIAAAIAATAPTSAGFSANDLPLELAHTGYGIADRLAKKGALIKINGGSRHIRFFTDAAMARAYKASCTERRRLKALEATANATRLRRLKRAAQALAQPRPPKPRKARKAAQPTHAPAPPPKGSFPRLPSASLKPSSSAEIIYPPGYRFTSRPMAQPRNQVVTVPFVHSGMGVMRA